MPSYGAGTRYRNGNMAEHPYLRSMPFAFSLTDYSVRLGDLQDTFPAWLRTRGYSKYFVLVDENTRRHCLPAFLEKTGLPDAVKILEIRAGEQYKTLETCEQVWQQMLDARLDRQALVVNLGGGVIGDLGGFCAATWKRGVDFVQVPTTLLAMTDAAIGGKLGIDFRGVKNTLGVFRNPAAVFADPAFLETLPERELRSGFAEVVKHALIGDPVLWNQLSESFKLDRSDGVTQSHPVTETTGASEAVTQSHRLTPDAWFELLQASVAVKVRVVQEDPLEKGLRAILNFGHTIGHALESYFLETDDPLTHGEAVAIGMVCESRIAGIGKLGAVMKVIKSHFPFRPIPEAVFPAIWELMQQDKKNAAGRVRMAVPGDEPFTLKILEPEEDAVRESLEFYNRLS